MRRFVQQRAHFAIADPLLEHRRERRALVLARLDAADLKHEWSLESHLGELARGRDRAFHLLATAVRYDADPLRRDVIEVDQVLPGGFRGRDHEWASQSSPSRGQ